MRRPHSLKAGLAEHIRTAPDILQFAKDRNYEKAWIIKSPEARPSTAAIEKYLAREKFEVLIVEYVWNSDDDDNRFVLTLFQDERVRVRDRARFVQTSVDLFYEKLPFATLMNALDAKIIGKTYLLQEPVDAVSLGIFNYWFSTGPINIWEAGEEFNEATVRERITARPDIERTRRNFQGLLFKFNVHGDHDGPYYGFKSPCCKKDGDLWVVDFTKTSYWMQFMVKREIGNSRTPSG
jgi:hypothetical protein